jgi:alkanesulfonate monooxygenase SsuD/methylene tetrahydromethanopterin reductase-like flavin-dependent oxidoreductase (luciferase family)
VPTVPVVLGDDVETCAEPVRAYSALYVGGMGSREKNFYNQLAVRMGFADAAAEVQERYLARDYDGAAAAVPFEFIDSTSLIGPPERVLERLHAFAEAGVTTLSVAAYSGDLDQRLNTLRVLAELLDRSGLGD